MKYRLLVIAMLAIFSVAIVSPSFARNDKKEIQQRVAAMTEEQKEARAAEIKTRVDEIKNMDKSNLSSDDRKALRQELRDMNTEAKAMGKGGIYISFAGIIIIILVLIIIL